MAGRQSTASEDYPALLLSAQRVPNGAARSKKEVYTMILHSTASFLLGITGQARMQAAQQVLCGFTMIFLCTVTASYLTAAFHETLPFDFKQKGTLSNISQDVSTPEGRLFAVGLVFGALFFIQSNYTAQLYRSWASHRTQDTNTTDHSAYQPLFERRLRGLWCVVPQVGFMLTGALPSLSGPMGTELVLSTIHNTAAPSSMLLLLGMETLQLAHGEGAFGRFCGWASDLAALQGPLHLDQKLRVVTCALAWFFGLIFIGIQVYMGVLKYVLDQPNQSYAVAATSYYTETACLVLVFFIPTVEALDFLYFSERDHAATSTSTLERHIQRLLHEEEADESA